MSNEETNTPSVVKIVTVGEDSLLIAKLPRPTPEEAASTIGKIILEPAAGGGGICCDDLCGID